MQARMYAADPFLEKCRVNAHQPPRRLAPIKGPSVARFSAARALPNARSVPRGADLNGHVVIQTRVSGPVHLAQGDPRRDSNAGLWAGTPRPRSGSGMRRALGKWWAIRRLAAC